MHGFIRSAATGHSHQRRYRTLFLSDLHLGTRSARTAAFLDFMRDHDAETIYLIGDIVDFWQLQRGMVWPAAHGEVLRMLLDRVRNGTRIILIPGNHDEALRSYCGMRFGGIEIARDFVHTTVSGRRLLILHGDEFDVSARYAKWLRFLGDRAYETVVWCDRPVNWMRRGLGLKYWSFPAFAKKRVKAAAAFVDAFETALAGEAKRRDLDGVVCGHIHHPADRRIDGIRYLNCGDWVESCTAIAEEQNGQLGLIYWQHPIEELKPIASRSPILEAA